MDLSTLLIKLLESSLAHVIQARVVFELQCKFTYTSFATSFLVISKVSTSFQSTV